MGMKEEDFLYYILPSFRVTAYVTLRSSSSSSGVLGRATIDSRIFNIEQFESDGNTEHENKNENKNENENENENKRISKSRSSSAKCRAEEMIVLDRMGPYSLGSVFASTPHTAANSLATTFSFSHYSARSTNFTRIILPSISACLSKLSAQPTIAELDNFNIEFHRSLNRSYDAAHGRALLIDTLQFLESTNAISFWIPPHGHSGSLTELTGTTGTTPSVSHRPSVQGVLIPTIRFNDKLQLTHGVKGVSQNESEGKRERERERESSRHVGGNTLNGAGASQIEVGVDPRSVLPNVRDGTSDQIVGERKTREVSEVEIGVRGLNLQQEEGHNKVERLGEGKGPVNGGRVKGAEQRGEGEERRVVTGTEERRDEMISNPSTSSPSVSSPSLSSSAVRPSVMPPKGTLDPLHGIKNIPKESSEAERTLLILECTVKAVRMKKMGFPESVITQFFLRELGNVPLGFFSTSSESKEEDLDLKVGIAENGMMQGGGSDVSKGESWMICRYICTTSAGIELMLFFLQFLLIT